jgi:polyisoprenoid-binding protein YceI
MISMVAAAAVAASMAAQAAPPPAYKADAAASHLQFTGVQAGAQFKGEFHQFTAAVVFAPDALADSHFDVQVDLNSLDTKDKDRDKTMRGSDIFDVARFPSAHYVTKSLTKTATGYAASGSLTLHGVTRDVPLEFHFTPAAAGATLEGTAQLKRLEFGVGQGDWKSTEWVADLVKVSFTLMLKPGT